MNGLKLLFLSTKPNRPSHRFRVEQILPHLERRGHVCSVGFFPKNAIDRFWFYRQLPQFDAVIIQQRLLHPVELKLVRTLSKTLVFDMDDAVMFKSCGRSCRRRQGRFQAMVRSVDLVICGNEFLRERVADCSGRARESRMVTILPTAIDTDRFRPGLGAKKPTNLVTIGWTGSRSSNHYLNAILPALARVTGPIELKVISDTTEGFDFSQLGPLPFRFAKWSAESELIETAEFDVGLMPLPNDNFSRGKCACKALQYMALGIPAVCSAVGMNSELIQPENNGFLPETMADWTNILDRLVADDRLRHRTGKAGRMTAVSEYSLKEIAVQFSDSLERIRAPFRVVGHKHEATDTEFADINQRAHFHFQSPELTKWRQRKIG